jgi:group I intron endonuclease
LLVLYFIYFVAVINFIFNVNLLLQGEENIYFNFQTIDLMVAGFILLKTYKDLSFPENFRSNLHRVGGVYGLINTVDRNNVKQYIGSSKDLYQRLTDHLKGRYSNSRLQRSINKYGLSNFEFVIYYWHEDLNVILTNIETEVIKSFPFESLYNFKKEANSSLGYKHPIKAINKMKLRFKNKSNHPMFGKTHTSFALSKISKPGNLNLMFNKKHTIAIKLKMSSTKSKTPIGLYDIENKFIEKFNNQVELANYLSVNKSTISRYLKSEKLFLNKYFIKKI